MQSKRKSGPTNPLVANLILSLKKTARENESGVWKSISQSLEKPRRRRVETNLSKIARHTSKNDQVVIAGKVLATGELQHAVTIAALVFSTKAKTKIEAVKGRAISIEKLMEENPKGSGIRILK